MKINLDKYYTPVELADKLIQLTFNIIGVDNISEIIEPSAGNGSFSDALNCIAYDIEPEKDYIIKQDFLKLELEYKEKRLIIGNPPFGIKNTLSVRFIKKSLEIADYVAFIQPISQYKTNNYKKADLIYSEILSDVIYSGIKVKTCFNIYKRNINKIYVKEKLLDVTIIESRRGRNNINDMGDLRINAWGSNIGKPINEPNKFTKEFIFKINNPKLKEKIINTIINIDWEKEYFKTTGAFNLTQQMVVKTLKEKIPEIK